MNQRTTPSTIDVAIPNYQYGHFLRDCVESVLNQGLPNLRVLIIDNASTDNSIQVATDLANADKRVQVIAHAENMGCLASWNEAIDRATAEYFLLLCADDYLAPGALKSAVGYLNSFPNISVGLGQVSRFRDGEVPSYTCSDRFWQTISSKSFLLTNCRNPLSYACSAGHALFRTKCLKRAGHVRPDILDAGDINLMLRVAELGDVAVTDSVIGYRRDHETNEGAAFREDFALSLEKAYGAFEDFFKSSHLSSAETNQLRKIARRSTASRAWWAGVSHRLRGKPESARKLFDLALSLLPQLAFLPPVDYLLRMERPAERIVAVMAAALKKDSRLA